jgi:hypothetical protein
MPGNEFTRDNRWERQWEFVCFVNSLGGAAWVFTSLAGMQGHATAALAGATFTVTKGSLVLPTGRDA